jgi:hypothetical protein
VLLQVGDDAGYRKICDRLLTTYADAQKRSARRSDTPFPTVCLLSAQAVRDPAKLATLAPGIDFDDFTNTQADKAHMWEAAYYRAGQFERAAAGLARMLPPEKASDPADWFFLAMAQHRLGQKDRAKTSLAKGLERMEEIDRAFADRRERLPTSGVAAAPTYWQMSLMRQILRREAEKVLTE